MNKRIKELAKQAGYTPLEPRTFADDLQEIFLQKFAELIVQECSKVITNGGYWHHMTKGWSQATPPEIAKMVREHFGVEE